jgi:hypothetical protein
MSRTDRVRSRARSGGNAYSVSPARWAPLRKITDKRNYRNTVVEVLECGHEQRIREDMIGETNAYRRRCEQCLRVACAAFGHPVAPDEWYEKRGRCRCAERDDLRDPVDTIIARAAERWPVT